MPGGGDFPCGTYSVIKSMSCKGNGPRDRHRAHEPRDRRLIVLLHQIAGPAIAVCPERALRTGPSFGVIDPFLMRAADDSICYYDRLGPMSLHESEDLTSNGGISPNVALLGEPALQCPRRGTLRIQNGNRGFGRARVIGTVERDSRDRIALKAATSFLLQR